MPMCSSVLLTFSSLRFSVVGFMLRSLIHLDLSFVHGDRYGFIFILLYVDIHVWQHHLLNMLSFSILYCFLPCQRSMFVGVWIDICVFYLVPLALLSVFMPIPGCFQHCYFSLQVDSIVDHSEVKFTICIKVGTLATINNPWFLLGKQSDLSRFNTLCTS